jgi:pilus assembly protein Flp/PilA
VGSRKTNDLFRCGRAGENEGKLALVDPLPAKDINPLTFSSEEISVKSKLNHFILCLQRVFQEDGQDLVEYALVVALIAFAATAGMRTLATSINGAFSSIASKLSVA